MARNKSASAQDAVLGEVGGFAGGPFARGFLFHVLAPSFAADFRRAAAEQDGKAGQNRQPEKFLGLSQITRTNTL